MRLWIPHHGDIDSAAWARPTFQSSWVGCMLVHLQVCKSEPDFSQQFISLLLQTCQLLAVYLQTGLCLSDSRWSSTSLFHSTENVGATHQLQWNLSHGQPYLGVKKSTAHIRPWWPRVNAVSCTQPDFSPGLFASVYIASLINRNYNNGSVLEDTLVCKF